MRLSDGNARTFHAVSPVFEPLPKIHARDAGDSEDEAPSFDMDPEASTRFVLPRETGEVLVPGAVQSCDQGAPLMVHNYFTDTVSDACVPDVPSREVNPAGYSEVDGRDARSDRSRSVLFTTPLRIASLVAVVIVVCFAKSLHHSFFLSSSSSRDSVRTDSSLMTKEEQSARFAMVMHAGHHTILMSPAENGTKVLEVRSATQFEAGDAIRIAGFEKNVIARTEQDSQTLFHDKIILTTPLSKSAGAGSVVALLRLGQEMPKLGLEKTPPASPSGVSAAGVPIPTTPLAPIDHDLGGAVRIHVDHPNQLVNVADADVGFAGDASTGAGVVGGVVGTVVGEDMR